MLSASASEGCCRAEIGGSRDGAKPAASHSVSSIPECASLCCVCRMRLSATRWFALWKADSRPVAGVLPETPRVQDSSPCGLPPKLEGRRGVEEALGSCSLCDNSFQQGGTPRYKLLMKKILEPGSWAGSHAPHAASRLEALHPVPLEPASPRLPDSETC